MSKNILVVAAHPDDEVLGCGGTILNHSNRGDNVYVIFFTNGVEARNQSVEEIKKRRSDSIEAASILGVHGSEYLDFPDNRLDSIPLLDIVKPLERLIAKIKPKIVYTHHHGDLNVDHRQVHSAVLTACRPQPENCVREIYAFEVLSSTEWSTPGFESFIPNFYVNIEDFLQLKLAAASAYQREMREAPHSRSISHIQNLAHHRGNCVGLIAAEAFQLIRAIR